MSDTLERVRKIVIDHLDADPEKVVESLLYRRNCELTIVKFRGCLYSS